MERTSRELSWDGSVNARDLGGLGRVRPGAVVRMEQPRRLTETGWAAVWDYGLFCWRLAANKPEPAVYQQVTDLLAAPPGQIRFADDSADNVQAALACGWSAVRYRSPGDLSALAG